LPSRAMRVQHATLDAVSRSPDDATSKNNNNIEGEDIGKLATKKLIVHPPTAPPVKSVLPNWQHRFSFSLTPTTLLNCFAECDPRTGKNEECHDICLSRAMGATFIEEQPIAVALLLEALRRTDAGGLVQNPKVQAPKLGAGMGGKPETDVGTSAETSAGMSAGMGVGTNPGTGVGRSTGTSEETIGDGLPRVKARRKRHIWTEEEDKHIFTMVGAIGRKWAEVAKASPGNSADAVRNRYMRLKRKELGDDISALSSSLRWTEQEEETLYDGISRFEQNWWRIAELLPGRTPRAVSHRFHGSRRKQLAALGQPDAPNYSILKESMESA